MCSFTQLQLHNYSLFVTILTRQIITVLLSELNTCYLDLLR